MPQLFAGPSAALLEHGTVIIDLHLLQAIHALSPSVTGPALHSCLSPVIISCMPASCTDDVLHASCCMRTMYKPWRFSAWVLHKLHQSWAYRRCGT